MVGVRTRANKNIIHEVKTRKGFDALFQRGPTVTAGAPTELKFLIDRHTHEIFFLPPKFPFHFNFYKEVIKGPLGNGEFNERAYNRPDRDFIAGTVTAYDSYVHPDNGKKGQVCFSLWSTDRFDAKLLKETRDAVMGGLKFLGSGEDVAFRPGGPIQDKILEHEKTAIKAAKIDVKTNIEISKGLKFVALSDGKAVGRLVIVDKGAAMPVLTRKDVVLFLGDVPPEAPPVAAIFTTTVQTYNSHLGIKCRQDNIPYFYKALTADEIRELKKLAGKPVEVNTTARDATVEAATQAQADAYFKKVKPKGRVRLTPNLTENKARSFEDLTKVMTGRDGRWNREALAAYGRKTAGVVEIAKLDEAGTLNVGGALAPRVIGPKKPIGIPANWYVRFVRAAKDARGVTFSDRIKSMTSDARFKDPEWKAKALKNLRDDMKTAEMPTELLKDLREQVAVPFLNAHPGGNRARMRSSSPVVEDGGAGKLPNMAGAFDSHTARWKTGSDSKQTADNCTGAMADALREDYASVFNDRAVAELEWHNVDLDEGSVTMAALVTPNEDDELANGVLRVNRDLAGFFSITGETQYGENLVTNPEAGAVPDTFIDGNYDVLNGQALQDIEYERESNLKPSQPGRKHAFRDDEIHVAYEAMHVLRDHFAVLDGTKPEDYIDECEVKVTEKGEVLFKQERPWVE